MASPSEQLFEHVRSTGLKGNRTLVRQILFLVAFFVVIRLGSFIPIPGVDSSAWSTFWTHSPLSTLGL